MSVSLKKLWNEYGIGGIIIAVVVFYGLYLLYKNLMSKGYAGGELMTQGRNQVYNNSSSSSSSSSTPQPANEKGNEVYGTPGGSSSMDIAGVPSFTANANANNSPENLLPKDMNSQWGLEPRGKGVLDGIGLLKAGQLIGINTIGQSLRNANLQIRSEPPNPQINVGPWNQTTIQPNFGQIKFEMGQGEL
jgi:hypothetical protein